MFNCLFTKGQYDFLVPMVSVFSLSLSLSDCFLQIDSQAGKVLYLNEEMTVIRLMLYTCSKEAYFEVRVYAKERGD